MESIMMCSYLWMYQNTVTVTNRMGEEVIRGAGALYQLEKMTTENVSQSVVSVNPPVHQGLFSLIVIIYGYMQEVHRISTDCCLLVHAAN